MSNAPNKECCCCSNLSCRKPEIETEYHKKTLLTRVMESFYDNCAAYNLRYIPYRTVTDRKTCLKSVMKDFIVLFCFLVTNFIVFLTILSRITMHLSGVMLVAIDWIRQALVSKASEYCRYQRPKRNIVDVTVVNRSFVRENQKPELCLIYKERGNGTKYDSSLTHQ